MQERIRLKYHIADIIDLDKISQAWLYSFLKEFCFVNSQGKRMSKLFVSLSISIVGVVSVHALPPAAARYGLAWSDEFNGTSLDTTVWSYDTGSTNPTPEEEYYTRSCVTVENGNLVIWCKYNPNGVDGAASPAQAKYTSAHINSGDKKIFTYGYFEVRMITPVGQVSGPGLWSTVWLLGNSINHGVAWPTCGEMEIYEQRPSDSIVGATWPNGPQQPVPATIGDNEFIASCDYGVNGYPTYHSCQRNYSQCLCDHYHTYGLLWDSTHVEYYFDDTLYWGQNYPIANDTNFGTPNINLPENAVAFHSPFYWIINIAISSAYAGYNINNAIFPTKMLIDYVRVYQRGVPVVKNPRGQHTPQSFALANPSTARLKVYDLSGKLVADYSDRVRRLKPGENAMKGMASDLPIGIYMARLFDGVKAVSEKLVIPK
jgi:beta-glucanase (GH16 family)